MTVCSDMGIWGLEQLICDTLNNISIFYQSKHWYLVTPAASEHQRSRNNLYNNVTLQWSHIPAHGTIESIGLWYWHCSHSLWWHSWRCSDSIVWPGPGQYRLDWGRCPPLEDNHWDTCNFILKLHWFNIIYFLICGLKASLSIILLRHVHVILSLDLCRLVQCWVCHL